MKKTFKDCPLHGHGPNGLGCYCEKETVMSKWVDEHRIMIEPGKWYITIEDAEKLIKECNKELEKHRSL